MNTMNKKEFEAWVDSRLDSFAQILPNKTKPWLDMSIKLQHKGNYLLNYANTYIGNFFIHCDLITGETTIFNTATKRFATAKCRIGDVFNVRIGVAIAWAKYNHKTVPDWAYSIPREELVNGDKFINPINRNHTFIFIGWLPDTKNDMIGKIAVVVDDKYRPLKTQIAETVIKIN